ncbi:MAG: TetR/AcrR family transcriptional regulator [Acidimicrobiia bacterium]
MSSAELPARDAVLAATVRVAGRDGLARLTVEEVAREADVSRASVYRWFPGGRDQLVEEAVAWEVGQFLTRLNDAVADASDFPTRLERGLLFAHRAIADHHVLQRLLATEPGGLLPQLQPTLPLVVEIVRADVARHLDDERLRPGVDRDEAADHIARLFVSFIGTPGRWSLDDPAEVRALVRDHLLAGVLERE